MKLAIERQRTLLSANPFNAGQAMTTLAMDSYAPFPFLPPLRRGKFGGIYEFRTYKLRPGGLPPPMLAAWEAAMEPACEYTHHLVVNMYALDGRSGSWTSGASRARKSVLAPCPVLGSWYVAFQGRCEHIQEATNSIALPENHSPLH